MRAGAPFAGGVLVGLALGASIGAVVSSGMAVSSGTPREPTVKLRNGLLEGWTVTRDDEAMLCTDPMVFIHAQQIECP